MNRSTLILCVGALLVAIGCEPDDADDVALAKDMAAKLAALGFEIDLDELSIESREPEECKKDLDKQQDLFYPENFWEGNRVLEDALGRPVPPTAEKHRLNAVERLAKTLTAYYQYDRRAIVLVNTTLGKISDRRALVTHELVHAWQDQGGGLQKLLRDGLRTQEQSMISQCLLEGHAEIVALAVMLGSRDALKDVQLDRLDPSMERFILGDARSLPYTEGRKLILRRVQQGGENALQTCLEPRPVSTEQILHPQKRGQDEPAEIDLPEWPEDLGAATLIHEDVLGEMGIYALLTDSSIPREKAYIAAAGWDGDRMRVYRTPKGGRLLVWRTVWDRPEDAEQFEETISGIFDGRIQRSGHRVDCIHANPDLEYGSLVEALTRHPVRSGPDARDAQTAAAVETAWRGQQEAFRARVEGNTWVLPKYGVAIPIPEGWSVKEARGIKVLAGAVGSGFGDNITVLEQPNPHGTDLKALRRFAEEHFRGVSWVTVDSISEARVSGRDVLMFEYHGSIPGRHPLRFMTLLYPEKDRQVRITATVLEKRWKEQAPFLRALFPKVRLGAETDGE